MTTDNSGNPSARPSGRRRDLLKAGIGAAALAAAPRAARPARAQGAFDWRRFEGQKIEVLLAKGPRGDLLQKYEREFTELTGIEVGSEQVPEQQQRQKAVIEFTSGATSFDVLMLALHVQKRLVAKGGWLVDLRPMLADPALTAPDYDFADFSEAGLRWATQPDGRIETLPINIDYHLLYANRDLFEAKGVKYPTTFEEMVAAAEALHDPAAGITGWVGRGLKNANVPVWTNLLLGWDVEAIDARGVMHTTEEPAVAAAELYKRLNVEYGPPGSTGFNWMEAQASFMQGRAAMWLDGIGFSVPVEDRTKSRVAGRVEYVMQPKGPKAQHSGSFADGMGVSAFSPKKEAGYLYVQWATSKAMAARQLQGGYGAPGRKGVYEDPQVLAGTSSSRAVIDAIVACSRIGRPSLPVVVPVTEFRDIFGIALTNMLGGADARAELEKATAQFEPILVKSEKG
jgi:multiple sugar transport system substrate-binding protein